MVQLFLLLVELGIGVLLLVDLGTELILLDQLHLFHLLNRSISDPALEMSHSLSFFVKVASELLLANILELFLLSFILMQDLASLAHSLRLCVVFMFDVLLESLVITEDIVPGCLSLV